MTKNLPIFFLLGFFISCQQKHPSQSLVKKYLPQEQQDQNVPEIAGVKSILDVPNEAHYFQAKIGYTNFQVSDEDKVEKAIEIIKKVIASPEFRDRVINFSYNGKKQFVDTKLSNEQVYLAILEGKETLRPVVDYEMDLDLQLYYSWRSTVGYTYPNQLKIFMNKKFFNRYTPAEVAGNIFHEWTHKLGFEHAFYYSISRDSSVPYALGYLIVNLGKQYE
ncbi:MAG: hypothetical protein AB7I27_18525 [Bacteriovoracaceae bacterium]